MDDMAGLNSMLMDPQRPLDVNEESQPYGARSKGERVPPRLRYQSGLSCLSGLAGGTDDAHEAFEFLVVMMGPQF